MYLYIYIYVYIYTYICMYVLGGGGDSGIKLGGLDNF